MTDFGAEKGEEEDNPQPFFHQLKEDSKFFENWTDPEQTVYIQSLLSKMSHHQQSQIDTYLKPMLKKDIISLLPQKGLDHVAENILSYLDPDSLCCAELVCRDWYRIIAEGMLWRRLIVYKVETDPLWRGLARRRGWIRYLFKPAPGEQHPDHLFYRRLFINIIIDIEATYESEWRGIENNLSSIDCRSESSSDEVYCSQYEEIPSITPKPLKSDSGSLVDYFCRIGEEPATQSTSPPTSTMSQLHLRQLQRQQHQQQQQQQQQYLQQQQPSPPPPSQPLQQQNHHHHQQDHQDEQQIQQQVYHNVKLKLEEKRRLIEQERKSAEDMWRAKRQDIGKEAFLRVISQSKKSDSGSQDDVYEKEGSLVVSSEKESSDTLSVEEEDEIPNFATDKGFFISFADEKLPQVKPPPLRPKCFRAVTVSRDRRNSLNELNHDNNNSDRLSMGRAPSIRSLASSENTSERSRSETNVPFRLNQRLSNHSNTSLNSSVVNNNTNLNENIVNTMFKSNGTTNSYPSSQKSGSNDGDSNKENNSDIMPNNNNNSNNNNQSDQPRSLTPGVGFIIGSDAQALDPVSELEMAKKKEIIMLQSLKRRAMQEEKRSQKETELARQRELERQKKEVQERKKEEEKMRRTMILEQYRLRKAQEDSDKDGNSSNFSNFSPKDSSRSGSTLYLYRPSRSRPSSGTKPRPKSLHVSVSNNQDYTSYDPKSSRINDDMDGNYSNYSSSILNHPTSGNRSTNNGSRPGSSMSTTNPNNKRLPSPTCRLPQLPASCILGRYKGGPSSDGASDAGSTFSEYTGPKLYVKPTSKSNRGIIVNAINVVLAGAVNNNLKKKVLEEINNSDSKHFLILFRGAGMQFRAIYSYNPDREDQLEVFKLHGNGPKMVTDDMMDKFYKYNCGGKVFNEVQTKHLSVTIDAFTIHNTLWAGKKVIPVKKDSF
ncbi:patronin-like [Panonychus citri]|uniref:patronin-like n=1 Tax=Panonychus citri TaxID=50023 RepID=UPI0023070A15|nr:patronin-like [Panonychus citri]